MTVFVSPGLQSESAITFFAFLQSLARFLNGESPRKRFDRREIIAVRHLEFAAILPGRGQCRVQLGRLLDSFKSFIGATQLR